MAESKGFVVSAGALKIHRERGEEGLRRSQDKGIEDDDDGAMPELNKWRTISEDTTTEWASRERYNVLVGILILPPVVLGVVLICTGGKAVAADPRERTSGSLL